MDFLSIKNLNTISNILNDIKGHGITIDINNIDLNDKDIGEIVNDEFANVTYFNAYDDIPYIPGYRKGHTSLSSKSVSINAYSKKNNKTNLKV